MAAKKDSKAPKAKAPAGEAPEMAGKIGSAGELKAFLQAVLDKMKEEQSASIYALSAINYVINLPQAYDYLNNENRELARDIWLRLKQTGLQLKNPPLLFADGDGAAESL